MAKRVEALVDSRMLVWARRNSGLGAEEAARRVHVKLERLGGWERGESRPTVTQLLKLAKAYNVSFAVFYLPEPPKDFPPMKDFRRLPGQPARAESPELRFEIRRARNRREIALELFRLMEGGPPEFSAKARLSDDPEKLAARIRNLLGVTLEDQTRFRDDYAAFRHWRSAFEKAGVLVFQARKVDLAEMRGFSISDTPLPAVVVNIAERVLAARVFTMLHELVHIMLGDGGLCDLSEARGSSRDRDVEVFCNRAAGAILVPKDDLLSQDLVVRKGLRGDWKDEEVLKLARRYRASREVLLRRLLTFGCTTAKFYQRKTAEWRQKAERPGQSRGEKGGGPAPYRVEVSASGDLFVRLVLDSYYHGDITSSDVSDYLNVKLQHLDWIESHVRSYPAAWEPSGEV